MQERIKKLADTISNNDLTQIIRQLRALSASLGNTKRPDLRSQLKQDQTILEWAHAFLHQRGKPSEQWRTSPACFEQLADWFEQTPSIENHLQLSMISWSCQFEHLLPNNAVITHRFIMLGSAFYAEPHKFIGFLYWLLTNGISPVAIFNATILHQFFAFQIFQAETLKKSYALLSNLSNNADQFLLFLKTQPCGLRGFSNNPQENGQYSSHNLLGGFFTHTQEFLLTNTRNTPSLSLESTYLDYAEPLFYLFEWELLRKLDYSREVSKMILKNLLQSEAKTKVLSALPFNILQGQFSRTDANAILPIIGTSLGEKGLLEIIQSEPFYIHAIDFNNDITFFAPHSSSVIHTLCNNTTYHSLHHLPFLITLAFNLRNALSDINATPPFHSADIDLIYQTIVDIILPYGNTIDDNVIYQIENAIPKLKPALLNKLQTLSHNIDETIFNFNCGQIDYETLRHLWGSQLSACNLIFRLQPHLPEAAAYPRTIYQLNSLILQKKCARCIAIDQPFILSRELTTMTSDIPTQFRIMRETLIHPSSQAQLIESILVDAQFNCRLDSLLLQSFGNTRSVVFHAFTTTSTTLQAALASMMPADLYHQQIMQAIALTLSEGRLREFEIAWLQITFNTKNTIDLIQILQHQLANFSNSKKTRNTCFSKLYFLLDKCNEKLPDGTLTTLLNEAIKYDNINFIKKLCNLTGENQLSPQDIQSALFNAGIEWETWGAIGLLCGLSGDSNINSTLVSENNIDLYLAIFDQYKKHYDTVVAPSGGLMYTNGQGESLLYIVANYGTLAQLKSIFNEIRTIFINTPKKIDALLNSRTPSDQIVACMTDHPDKEAINQFLDEARNAYERYRVMNDDDSTDEDETVIEDDDDAVIDIAMPLNGNYFFSPEFNNRRERSESQESEQSDPLNPE